MKNPPLAPQGLTRTYPKHGLELGDDRALLETATVLAFGFPFGQGLKYGHELYPNISVMAGQVMGFHGPRERLDAVQFDGQINPGQSGGPVHDVAGDVIGVDVVTIPGRSINLA